MRLATVANFPHGGDDIAAAAEETAAAVAAGADEVDVVAPIGALLEGDVGLVGELIEACRAAAGPGITLKLILETGTPARAGPDHGSGARRGDGGRRLPQDLDRQEPRSAPRWRPRRPCWPYAARPAAGSASRRPAASGPPADAAGYLHLADAIMGPDWARPRTFRFGASSLLDDLLGPGRRPPAATDAAFLPQEIIRAKRDGNELAADEIDFFVHGLTDGSIAEGQVAALAMAVFLRGMTRARRWR